MSKSDWSKPTLSRFGKKRGLVGVTTRSLSRTHAVPLAELCVRVSVKAEPQCAQNRVRARAPFIRAKLHAVENVKERN